MKNDSEISSTTEATGCFVASVGLLGALVSMVCVIFFYWPFQSDVKRPTLGRFGPPYGSVSIEERIERIEWVQRGRKNSLRALGVTTIIAFVGVGLNSLGSKRKKRS